MCEHGKPTFDNCKLVTRETKSNVNNTLGYAGILTFFTNEKMCQMRGRLCTEQKMKNFHQQCAVLRERLLPRILSCSQTRKIFIPVQVNDEVCYVRTFAICASIFVI